MDRNLQKIGFINKVQVLLKKCKNTIKKAAFTFAEVLLTLTIIGVISSLTIPSLLSNVQQSQYNAGLNNIYQQLGSALQSIQANGGMVHAGMSNSSNLALASDFCNVMSCVTTNSTPVQFAGASNYLYYRSTLTDTTFPVATTGAYPVMLNNGVYLMFWANTSDWPVGGIYTTNPNAWPGTCVGWIIADINGSAGPNMWGEDTYSFDIILFNGAYSIVPSGNGANGDSSTCSFGSITHGTSIGCTYQRLYNPSSMQ